MRWGWVLGGCLLLILVACQSAADTPPTPATSDTPTPAISRTPLPRYTLPANQSIILPTITAAPTRTRAPSQTPFPTATSNLMIPITQLPTETPAILGVDDITFTIPYEALNAALQNMDFAAPILPQSLLFVYADTGLELRFDVLMDDTDSPAAIIADPDFAIAQGYLRLTINYAYFQDSPGTLYQAPELFISLERQLQTLLDQRIIEQVQNQLEADIAFSIQRYAVTVNGLSLAIATGRDTD